MSNKLLNNTTLGAQGNDNHSSLGYLSRVIYLLYCCYYYYYFFMLAAYKRSYFPVSGIEAWIKVAPSLVQNK